MSRTPPNARLLRRARKLVSLGTVALMAVPLIGWSNVVTVDVDGDLLRTRTYAATVGAVLEQLDVPVGPADRVSPSPDTPLEKGVRIGIDRAITVDVRVNGERVRRVTAPVSSVSAVLTAADLDVRDRGWSITPAWTAAVEDGDVIDIAAPLTLALTVDGGTREVTTHASTVAAVLAEEGIELGRHDEIDWDLDAELIAHSNVVIERVAYDEVIDEVTLPRGEQRRETSDLRKGTTRVADDGQDGLRRDTYRVELRDGEEVERELIDQELVREARDRVILVGTYVPPPPPPPPSGGSDAGVWDRLARCESGGNWSINSGNGYYGGLQFRLDTWRNVGGSGYPHENSKAEQIKRAEILLQRNGGKYSRAWPHCSRQLGLP